MATTSIFKDANEAITYTFDLSATLASGEDVSSVTITSSPSGLTIGTPVISGQTFQVKISAGAAGQVYSLTLLVVTSNANTHEICATLTIQSSCWMKEMLLMLRFLINDAGTEQVYSDTRLIQVLLMAAQFVQTELKWSPVYSINIVNSSIDPDPAEEDTRDVDFMNFVVLKAACFVDQSTARTKALAEGIRAQCGPASLSVSGNLDGFLKLLEVGPCKSYADLRKEWLFGRATIRAVFSPFVSNRFMPSSDGYYNRGESNR